MAEILLCNFMLHYQPQWFFKNNKCSIFVQFLKVPKLFWVSLHHGKDIVGCLTRVCMSNFWKLPSAGWPLWWLSNRETWGGGTWMFLIPKKHPQLMISSGLSSLNMHNRISATGKRKKCNKRTVPSSPLTVCPSYARFLCPNQTQLEVLWLLSLTQSVLWDRLSVFCPFHDFLLLFAISSVSDFCSGFSDTTVVFFIFHIILSSLLVKWPSVQGPHKVTNMNNISSQQWLKNSTFNFSQIFLLRRNRILQCYYHEDRVTHITNGENFSYLTSV